MLRAASAMGTPRAAAGGAKRARTSPALGEARAAAVREALLQWSVPEGAARVAAWTPAAVLTARRRPS